MEKNYFDSLLLDFYGAMLTEKQNKVMELYLEQDVSLSEIASLYDLSRQAVYDIVKNAEKTLQFYEDKLFLVKHYIENKSNLDDCLKKLETIDNKRVDEVKEKIKIVIENL